ncbi:hypothetical protein HN388_06410 [bacterium]|nr:hypothetical protein [bacterium]
MKRIILLLLCLILMVGCSDSASQKLEIGTYSGEYTVINNYGSPEEYSNSGVTELTLDQDSYNLTGETYITPPFSSGHCNWTGTSITFQDTINHTANFDWTLIIGGTYNYSYDDNALEMSQVDTDNNRKYTYSLTKD